MPDLFAYGTLRDPDMLPAVLGRPVDSLVIVPATAMDLAAVPYPSRVYPALVRRPGARAEGLLISGLAPADLTILDAFEGDEYRRLPLEVIAAGTRRAAEAYWPVVSVGQDAAVWSLAEWQRNHKAAVLVAEAAAASAIRARLLAR